jgi:hypothetical protein
LFRLSKVTTIKINKADNKSNIAEQVVKNENDRINRHTKIIVTMRLCALLFIYTIPVFAFSQSFTYTARKDQSISFAAASDSIVLNKSKKTKEAYIEREATVNGVSYRFSQLKSNKKVLIVTDASGAQQALVSFETKSKYSIFLPDGRELDWVSPNTKKWSYQLNGKDVIKARYYKDGKARKIEFVVVDKEVVTPGVLLACMERGENVVAAKSQKIWPYIAIAVFVGIAQAASSN